MPSLIHNFSGFRGDFANLEMTFSANYPIISPDDAEGITAVVTPDTASEHINQAFLSLSDVLGVQFNNYCDLVYDSEGQLVWVGLPQIATYRNLSTGLLEPALIVGTSKTDKSGISETPQIFSQTIIPLEYKEDDYYLMKHKLSLHTQPNQQDNTKPPTVLIKLEVKKGDTFYFRIKTKAEYPQIKDAFDGGELLSVLDSIEVSWFSATNFLKPTIEAGLFPEGGIFLLLENPRYSANPYNGTLLESIGFNVSAISHPGLLVQTSAKIPVLLNGSDVSNLKFNSNAKAFDAYQSGLYKGKPHILLHFIRPSEDDKGNLKSDHTPVHSIGTDLRIFLPHAKEAFSKLLSAVLGSNLPVTPSSDPKTVKQMKSAAVSDDFAEIPF